MAIMRLKQWAFDRAALRAGRTTRMEFSGWRARRQREADSRQVRVIDFELALSKLDPMHRQILLLTYRDGIRHAQAAYMLGCSVKNIYYLLPAARRRLADTLDRLDLL
jgi:DNA-directed RNA polymerase specialized sigma24 family protein